jgi:hypothetical protein
VRVVVLPPRRRFYLLFQHHCRYDNAAAISKTMGHLSSHTVRCLGACAQRRRDVLVAAAIADTHCCNTRASWCV